MFGQDDIVIYFWIEDSVQIGFVFVWIRYMFILVFQCGQFGFDIIDQFQIGIVGCCVEGNKCVEFVNGGIKEGVVWYGIFVKISCVWEFIFKMFVLCCQVEKV